MDHGVGQGGVLADVHLAGRQVESASHLVGGGAAGDEVQFAVLLQDHHVVNLLGGAAVGHVQGSLGRRLDLDPLLDPDEISLRLRVSGNLGGDVILVRRHCLPEVVLTQPVILLQRLGDGQHLQAVNVGDHAQGQVVAQHVGGRSVLLAGVHADIGQRGRVFWLDLLGCDQVCHRSRCLTHAVRALLVAALAHGLQHQMGIARTGYASVQQDVCLVGLNVVQDMAGVGDDDARSPLGRMI